MNNQKHLAQKTKDLHKKLCDATKDPSTKMELKQKIANLEKQLSDAEKQIGKIEKMEPFVKLCYHVLHCNFNALNRSEKVV